MSATTPAPEDQPTHRKPSTIAFISLLALLLAVAITRFATSGASTTELSSQSTTTPNTANLSRLRRFFSSPVASAVGRSTVESTTMSKTPVYFLSHGGPNIMYDHQHPAYHKLGEIGREITTKVKPRAVVVFSAHWQGKRDTIQVNTAEITELIYDFYGFPSHYYKEKYPNVGSKEVAEKVLSALGEAGIKAEGVKRGLDHGVWASFKCAFEPEKNPLNVPIVQVSLFDTEDPVQHYRLGQAVSKLREENILIIVSGMAVHNLRDLQFSFGDPRPLPYTASFDEALKDAATAKPAEREQALVDLLKRPDARKAHPTFDHLLPIHIGAGAAGDDKGRRLWTLKEGSMSWAQYRFGEIANNTSSL
ncbi:DODA-type extradiol aromatic ring-opening family dioxygenase [Aspergillus aculeatinus CBS 121060]|nr:aromatic ring-opening dioxygenase LigB subunit [Aspergillus aculeatinus CBS 121060]RAH65322.1 aromatic ring-opening dioxygenase LigB subunit [Aspergillus aculeatinus CBS 121060]